MTNEQQDHDGEPTPLRDQLVPQLEAMSDTIDDLTLHLHEISTWHGLSTVGVHIEPPVAWGFRSGGDEQLLLAEIEFPVDHEQLPFEPCDEARWRRIVGSDRPYPRRPTPEG